MAEISGLPDDLLVKILAFLPTKVAISTSVLSKQWRFLWMWLPKLKYDDYDDITDGFNSVSAFQTYRDFIAKNLPLHRAPIIESLSLGFRCGTLQPEDLKSWVEVAVSRSVRFNIRVDVPPTVCLLPSLRTLELKRVRYLNEDSLRMLLSFCPVLEYLSIERHDNDNLRGLVVDVPSLRRLSLTSYTGCSSDDYVIVTPSLKYFKAFDYRSEISSYKIEKIPELEEADISIERNPEKLFVYFKSIKCLSLQVDFNSKEEPGYDSGIVFNHLEELTPYIHDANWSKLLFRLLNDSPKLRVLEISNSKSFYKEKIGEYLPVSWSKNQGSVPKCFLNSLETFRVKWYYSEEQEDRDFLSLIFKHARCLKSTSILHR
ncbi:F-box domain [Arabidopsis thaliana x Arabidopsis arenosa]|uniref:F-box domain n=1 Tax=Arabidopsis thaliana x Arabidopsis arenosa TaxID=1240361 RepID=A0A8T2D1D9_9BRAS|nr:F-box domain [Arabidopsis thaliana x Arabidopsis arenosa]